MQMYNTNGKSSLPSPSSLANPTAEMRNDTSVKNNDNITQKKNVFLLLRFIAQISSGTNIFRMFGSLVKQKTAYGAFTANDDLIVCENKMFVCLL